MDIRLTHITKAFGEKVVLKDFSHVFAAGRRYAILAPSGKGKTTLLRLVLGLESPDAGSISGVPSRCAAVFQEDRLCRNLTVLGNLRMALGHTVSREAMLAALDRLGLGDAGNLPASQLSGGMARRVALARAILSKPELLVLDEPFTGLDSGAIAASAAAIRTACPQATILLVTHRPEDCRLLDIQETVYLI